MNNYYNELSKLSVLKKEIDKLATSLQDKKSGCYIQRFEHLLNFLPNEFLNQFNFRNKIEDYIINSSYEKDVKNYILQVFISFYESIEIVVPASLKNVVNENERVSDAMYIGFLNFEKGMKHYYIKSSYISPLQFDVFTQSYSDYILEFNQNPREFDKLTLQYELEQYSWLKEVANYSFNGIDYKNPPNEEVRKLLNIDVEILENKNSKKVYDNCFWIVDFLEQQAGNALPSLHPEIVKSDEYKKDLHNNIFKGNAFEVFEKYHFNRSVSENSKSDLSVLFQLFKNDNLFVETVELKHYIIWLNTIYDYALVEIKKVDIKTKRNIQRTNDYMEFKKTTLKQP